MKRLYKASEERGVSTFDAILGMALFALVITIAVSANSYYKKQQNYYVTAGQIRKLASSTRNYVMSNATAIANNIDAGGKPVELTIETLKNAGDLSDTFEDINPFKQSYAIFVSKDSNDKLSFLIATTGGTEFNAKELGSIASKIGENGGGVSDGKILGTDGGWKAEISTYDTSGSVITDGHIVVADFYDPDGGGLDYLARGEVPGHPEANRMLTDLDMNGNKILNADITAQSLDAVSGSFTGDISGANLDLAENLNVDGKTTTDELEVTGDSTFGGNVGINGNLAVAGDTTLNNLAISGDLLAASIHNPSDTWFTVANNDLKVEGRIEADGGITSTLTATKGDICAINGTIAQSTDGTGSLLVCKSNNWSSLGGAGGSAPDYSAGYYITPGTSGTFASSGFVNVFINGYLDNYVASFKINGEEMYGMTIGVYSDVIFTAQYPVNEGDTYSSNTVITRIKFYPARA